MHQRNTWSIYTLIHNTEALHFALKEWMYGMGSDNTWVSFFLLVSVQFKKNAIFPVKSSVDAY